LEKSQKDKPEFYTVFDYDSLSMDFFEKKIKCCKNYKKKGKFHCDNCPK